MSTKQDTLISLDFGQGSSDHVVECYDLHEAISHTYECKIRFLSKSPQNASSLIGKPASVTIERNTGKTQVRGIVSHVQALDKNTAGTMYPYAVTIVPAFSSLRLNRYDKVYGGDAAVSVIDLFQQKCNSSQISYQDNTQKSSYPSRDFVVQYNESDADFLQRLLEYWGVYYYFDVSGTEEKIVLEDNNVFKRLSVSDGSSTLKYGFSRSLDDTVVPLISSFSQHSRAAPSKVIVRDYNPNQPAVDLQTESAIASGQGSSAYMDYGTGFTDQDVDGKFLAQVRAQEINWQSNVFRFSSNTPSVRVGYIFTLSDSNNGADGDYIVVSAHHHFCSPAPAALGGSTDLEAHAYTIKGHSISNTVAYRPARKTEWPHAGGLFTATIDGAASSSIAQMDAQGRYKVRFHFDASSGAQEKASSYIRRAGDYDGPGDVGMHHPLLRGTEVVVAFENGDIDRPIIVGAVSNGSNSNPVSSSNAVSNLLRTPSGSIIEVNDGTLSNSPATTGSLSSPVASNGAVAANDTTGTNTAAADGSTSTSDYAAFVRLASPAQPADVTSGSYFRLGAYVPGDEASRIPSSASVPLQYSKHTVKSTDNPEPEPKGVEWQDYVKAGQEGQDAGTNADGSSKGLVRANGDGFSECSVPASAAEVDDSVGSATPEDATAGEDEAINPDTGGLNSGYVFVSNGVYLRPGYTQDGKGGYNAPGYSHNANGKYVKQPYSSWTKQSINGTPYYIEPGYTLQSSTSSLTFLKPGFVINDDGTISKQKSTQLELNTISLEEAYVVTPSGDGVFLLTNQDVQTRVDGGLVMQVGKGFNTKVIDGDYQVAVDDGALLMGASSGVDIRAGSKDKPANISLTAYGYIKQEAKGPVSTWNYSNAETRTYGSAKTWFYGSSYTEIHGVQNIYVLGASKTTVNGHRALTYLGARTFVVLGLNSNVTVGMADSTLIGSNLSIEVSGFFRTTMGLGLNDGILGDVRIIGGATLFINIGGIVNHVEGTRIQYITNLLWRHVNGGLSFSKTGGAKKGDMKRTEGVFADRINLRVALIQNSYIYAAQVIQLDELVSEMNLMRFTHVEHQIVQGLIMAHAPPAV